MTAAAAADAPGGVVIRDAVPADAGAMSTIHAPFVLETVITFDEEPLDASGWAAKVEGIQRGGWPVLVAVVAGELVGFAYVAPFRPKAAYRYTVEDTIYLAPAAHGRGIGRLLLTALLTRAAEAGAHEVIAVIASSAAASLALHERLGFVHVGTLARVGFKLGGWVDTVQMQLSLGQGDTGATRS
jgi:L-amino acid N-acyltransferase YncA